MFSTINYVNHLKKEVAHLYVNDMALPDLYKWEWEVGEKELFPFDLVKRCDEIHKTRRLEKTGFKTSIRSSCTVVASSSTLWNQSPVLAFFLCLRLRRGLQR